MSSDNESISIKPVLEAINRSLSNLAAVSRLPYFYSESEAKSLVDDYRKLRAAFDADSRALDIARKAARKGAGDAPERTTDFAAASDARQESFKAVGKFAADHPLIAEIVDGSRPWTS
ncbi:hypothetical protein [Xanthomonas arboricola]|uniref:Uncharacterized protein n=1 Tax=Xanthomonas arboricola TaxID=56448 RepID=A0AB73H275_9XANT|nr:hypothetical protein [Xanthomonas arboricola]MBB5672500.1 hypothetical protein [Xanthomonas arboricola]